MGFKLDWRGNAVADEMRAAELAAVQETIEACAEQASSARSGSIADIVAEPAEDTGNGVSGRWGLFPEPQGDPHYELFWEVGTAYIPGDSAKRSAMDAQYPRLAERIRDHRG